MRRGKWKKVKDSLFPGPSPPVSPSSSIISFLNLKVNSSRLEHEAIDRIRISRNFINVCRNIRLTGMEMETWRDNDSLLKRNLETCCPVFRSWRDCTVESTEKCRRNGDGEETFPIRKVVGTIESVSFDISTEYFEWLIKRKHFDFCSTKRRTPLVRKGKAERSQCLFELTRRVAKKKRPLCNVPRGKEWSLTRLSHEIVLVQGQRAANIPPVGDSPPFFFFLPHFFYSFYSSNSYYFFPRGKITVSQRVAECPEAQVRVFFTLGWARQESLERTRRRNLTMAIK